MVKHMNYELIIDDIKMGKIHLELYGHRCKIVATFVKKHLLSNIQYPRRLSEAAVNSNSGNSTTAGDTTKINWREAKKSKTTTKEEAKTKKKYIYRQTRKLLRHRQRHSLNAYS